MIIKLTHREYGGSYDFDTETQELTSVLRIYDTDDTVTYQRFAYVYYEDNYVQT